MKLAILLVLAASAIAETSQEKGKRLVKEAVQALGGDGFLHLRDHEQTGRSYSFYREELTGLAVSKIYTRYRDMVKDPAHNLAVEERQYYGKKQESSVLFLQDEAYDLTFRGARPIAADRFARYQETTLRDVLYILRVRFREPGLIFDGKGADVLSNRPIEIVEIVDSDNRVTTVYFDQTTKLPIRQVFFRRDPATKERNEEITEYSKYRDIGGGVQWPYAVHRERNGEKIYEMFAESGESNKDYPDDQFRLPSNIKLLKRQ
jgi:hypothetical protein